MVFVFSPPFPRLSQGPGGVSLGPLRHALSSKTPGSSVNPGHRVSSVNPRHTVSSINPRHRRSRQGRGSSKAPLRGRLTPAQQSRVVAVMRGVSSRRARGIRAEDLDLVDRLTPGQLVVACESILDSMPRGVLQMMMLSYERRQLVELLPWLRRQLRRHGFRRRTHHMAVLHVTQTRHNTLVTLTTVRGRVVVSKSAGCYGYRHTRGGSLPAAQRVLRRVAQMAQDLGYRRVMVWFQGRGRLKNQCLRTLAKTGLRLRLLGDRTALPHNGCRPPKRRRL
jgi:small subunit ribosomal protein S11